MKCPVCDKRNTSMLCTNCGFDSSKDCERYPTFGMVGQGKAVAVLRQEWQKKQVTEPLIEPMPRLNTPTKAQLAAQDMKKRTIPIEEWAVPKRADPPVKKRRLLLMLIPMVMVLMMVLGIIIGLGIEESIPMQPDGGQQIQEPAESEQVITEQPTDSPALENSDTVFKIAMITAYGDVTDQSYNQATYEACKAFTDDNGIAFQYYMPASDSTAERVAMVDAAVINGCNVIVMTGWKFGETLADVAPRYPDVKFIAMDLYEGEGGFTPTENTYAATYKEEVAGYMAGYAAVKMGYRHLGFLGGIEVPEVQRYGYGYLQGIDAASRELGISSDVKVEYVYANQSYSEADIAAVMEMWYHSFGVEVVFATDGLWYAAGEAAASASGKVIGVDFDQSAMIDGQYGAGITITSATKGVYRSIMDTLTDVVLNGRWSDYAGKTEALGVVSFNSEENYVQLPFHSTQWSNVFAREDYLTLVSELLTGMRTVSDDVSEFPSVEVSVEHWANIK